MYHILPPTTPLIYVLEPKSQHTYICKKITNYITLQGTENLHVVGWKSLK